MSKNIPSNRTKAKRTKPLTGLVKKMPAKSASIGAVLTGEGQKLIYIHGSGSAG